MYLIYEIFSVYEMSYLRNVLSVKCIFIAKVLKDGGTDPEKTISYLDETITGTKDT